MGVRLTGVVSIFLWASVAGARSDHCFTCHQEYHPELVTSFKDDIHYSRGLSCSDCHGGNPDIPDESGMDKKYGFVGVPKPTESPQFCARCHSDPAYMRPFNPTLPTDQLEKYRTSHHGEKLRKGDIALATCVSCHSAHFILPATDPRSTIHPLNVAKTCARCHANAELMSRYGIPTHQFEQYTDSLNVHGYSLYIKGDLSAPTCNDCHGNHGAAPPGVAQVSQVCTQCHSLNGEYFRKSVHKEAFDALGLMECAFCHQKDPDLDDPAARIHTIVAPKAEMVSAQGLCGKCHSAGDKGMEMAIMVSSELDSLHRKLDLAEELLRKAEREGMEVSDAKWKLKSEVLQARMELRTAIHMFDPESYRKYYQRADTSLRSVLQAGLLAGQEIKGRRLYFLILTFFVILTVIALILKIRQINRERANTS